MERQDYIDNILKRDGLNAYFDSSEVKLRTMMRDYFLENDYTLEYANKLSFIVDVKISDRFFQDKQLLKESIFSAFRQIDAIVDFCQRRDLDDQIDSIVKEQVNIVDLVYLEDELGAKNKKSK